MEKKLRKAYSEMRKYVFRRDPSIALAFSLFPTKKGRAGFAAAAFCRYMDDIVDEPEYAGKRKKLLDKAEKDLEQCYKGNATESMYIALADTLSHYPIPIDHFKELINGLRRDLNGKKFKTFKELEKYIRKIAVAPILISSYVANFESDKDKNIKGDTAIGIHIQDILYDIGEDVKRDRVYLPLEDLKKFNYSLTDLKNEVINEQFKELIEFQIKRALLFLKQGGVGIENRSLYKRFFFYLGCNFTREKMNQIRKRNYDVFSEKIQLPIHKKIKSFIKAIIRGIFNY